MKSSKRTSIERSGPSTSRSRRHALQHRLDAVGPPAADAVGVDRRGVHARGVGDHRRHRDGDGDRVAVGHDDGGVGEHVGEDRAAARGAAVT